MRIRSTQDRANWIDRGFALNSQNPAQSGKAVGVVSSGVGSNLCRLSDWISQSQSLLWGKSPNRRERYKTATRNKKTSQEKRIRKRRKTEKGNYTIPRQSKKFKYTKSYDGVMYIYRDTEMKKNERQTWKMSMDSHIWIHVENIKSFVQDSHENQPSLPRRKHVKQSILSASIARSPTKITYRSMKKKKEKEQGKDKRKREGSISWQNQWMMKTTYSFDRIQHISPSLTIPPPPPQTKKKLNNPQPHATM